MNKKKGLIATFIILLVLVGVYFVLGGHSQGSVPTVNNISINKSNAKYIYGYANNWSRVATWHSYNITVNVTGTDNNNINITEINITIPSTHTPWNNTNLSWNHLSISDPSGVMNWSFYFDNVNSVMTWHCCGAGGDKGFNLSGGALGSFYIVLNNTATSTVATDTVYTWTVQTLDNSSATTSYTYTMGVDGAQSPRVTSLVFNGSVNASTTGTWTLTNGTDQWLSGNDTDMLYISNGTIEVTIALTEMNPANVSVFWTNTTGSRDTRGLPDAPLQRWDGNPIMLTTTQTTSPYTFKGHIAPENFSGKDNILVTFFVLANDTFNHTAYLRGDTEVYRGFNITIDTSIPTINFTRVGATDTDTAGLLTSADSGGVSGIGGIINNTIRLNVTVYDQRHVANGTYAIPIVRFCFKNSTGCYPNWTRMQNVGVNIYHEINISGAGTNYSYAFPTSLVGDGRYNISFNITDGANWNTTERIYNVQVDNVGPSATISLSSATITPSATVTITCSATDIATISATSTRPEVKKPGDNSFSEVSSSFSDTGKLGTYYARCYGQDNLTHSGYSSEVSFLVAETSSGGAGGGAGGGAVIFDVDFSKVEEKAITKAQGSIVSFTFEGSTKHTIKFDKVTETSVTLTIASTPKTITVNVGETKEVDINDDGTNDMGVTLNKVVSGRADISIKKLAAGAEKLAEEEKKAVEEEGEVVTPAEEKANLTWLWILIVIIVIAIIAWLALKKKKR